MLKFVGPLIVVGDMAAARHFYENLLGQKVEMDFGENVSFAGNFSIHFKPHFQNLLGGAERFPVAEKANNGELYFETDDLDGIYRRLSAANVSFIHPVIEQPWGQRAMRFYDPDGHIIETGESMEAVVVRLHAAGQTDEAIHQKTGMPLPFIEAALRSPTP